MVGCAAVGILGLIYGGGFAAIAGAGAGAIPGLVGA